MRKRKDGKGFNISPSFVTSFFNCPIDAKMRYLDGKKGVSNMNFVRGSAVHDGLEAYWQMIQSYPERAADPALLEKIVTIAKKKLIEIYEKEIQPYPELRDPLLLSDYVEWLPLAFEWYVDTYGDVFKPIAVEGWLNVKICTAPDGQDLWLNGRTDNEFDVMRDFNQYKKGERILADTKTKQKKGGIYKSNVEQLKYYMVGLHILGKQFDHVELHNHVFKQKTTPKRGKGLPIRYEFYTNRFDFEVDEFAIEMVKMKFLAVYDAWKKCAWYPSGITGAFGCSGCGNRFNCDFYEME